MPRPVSKIAVPRRPAARPKAPQPAANASEPRTILLHFHIFKNAGTSLDAALKKNLGPAWMEVEGDDPNDRMDWGEALRFIDAHPEARAVSSHTLRYPPPPSSRGVKFVPLVLLRHPIDRLASIYYFERANVNTSHPETNRIALKGSLADFVNFTLTERPELGCDAQTSFIARSGIYHRAPSNRNLAAAKSAVRDLFLPGVVEKLDQYLALLELEGSRLLPNLDLAQLDENRNPERAPTLLARLRQIRAQLPPRLWRKLCERNRLDLELWRYARRLARARFDQTPGATDRLTDFHRRKASVNVAALPIARPLQPEVDLPWTGERLVESAAGDLVAEHLHRYALALEFAGECDVLDVACGEGYGSAFLAKVARNVIGVDCATSVIAHASAKYKAKNLSFVAGQAEKLPVRDSSIDLVVSFETLEHLEDHDAMLREIKRVLRPNGRLLLSTPDREAYRKASGKSNAFHVRELSLRQFQKLLAAHFRHATIGRQKSVSGSWIVPLADFAAAQAEYSGSFRQVKKENAGEGAPYLVALASDMAVPALQASLFNYNSSREIGLKLESLRQQRDSERKAYTILKAEFDQRTAWAKALDSDLQRTRTLLAEQTKLVEERTAWAKALDSDLQDARAAFAEQSRLTEERTAWAKSLDVELEKARTTLAEQAQLVEESSAWGKSLSGELQSAQKHLAKLTKEHAERTAWAKSLDAELKKARADFTAQSRLVEERTTWAKSLDADLQQARTALAAQTNLVEERSVWGKALTDELQLAQKHLAKLTKEYDERTAWAKSLDIELTKARTALSQQAKLVEERTTWAKSLDTELQKTRTTLAAQTKLVEERSAWGKSLNDELQLAQKHLAKLTKELDERTAWAKSLDADLQKSRALLAEQSKLVEERSLWGKSLEAELRNAQTNFAKLSKEDADRTAWAQQLDAQVRAAAMEIERLQAEHTKAVAWAQQLDTELAKSHVAYRDQTKLVEDRTAWAKALDTELDKARALLAEQTKLVEERSSWGKSLEAELRNAQTNFAKLSKEDADRTAWAQQLDAQVGAAATEIKRLQAEHAKAVAWAQQLDTELAKSYAAHRDQAKLVEDRTAWAKSLDADLQKSRALLAEQSKLVEERSLWGKSLEAELRNAQTNFAKLTNDHAEAIAWAQRLDAELVSTRVANTEQANLIELRTVWAKSLDSDLQKAWALMAEQTKLVEERSAWGQALEIELRSARNDFAHFTEKHSEAVAWAQRLDAELVKARAVQIEQSHLIEERTIWAQSLDADLQRSRALLAEQTKLVEERSLWGKSLEAELKQAHASAAEREELLQETLRTATVLRRDLLVKNAEANATASVVLDARVQTEVAESEARRLAASLTDAVRHIEHLLAEAELLKRSLDQIEADRLDTAESLRQRDQDLNSTLAKLQATQAELSRYESRLLCRLLAQKPANLSSAIQP